MDEGDTDGVFAVLRHELAPTPGRLANTVRLVAIVVVTVAISEIFHLPETSLSAYIVLFVSKAERASTVKTALLSGIAVVLALLITIVVFMASLSEPALRLPLIALVTFVAMFAARVSPLGPIFFAGGFIIAYGLTLGDEVLALSLQPGSVANTPEFALPELAFATPEESLVHFLLWLALAVALPVAVVIVANLLTGRDPALLLRAALAARLAAAEKLCADAPGATRALASMTRTGISGLLALQKSSSPQHRRASDPVLIDAVGRLCLLLLAIERLPITAQPARALEVAGYACVEAEAAIRNGTTLPPESAPPDTGPDTPLAGELARTLGTIRHALASPVGEPANAKKPAPPGHGLLSPDAFTNPANARFAFKVTLAMLLCYAGQSLSDWPGIHTCIITCFFVSLGTVGETLHKATLRIIGCLIGGALGIGTILFLMPLMTDLGDLLLVLACVTFVAAWVASGSERIAYAGLQIGIAFYLTVLQGSGPTLDMETARDRIVGILVGNIVVFVIFTTIWPISVGSVVRPALAKAIGQLASLLDLLPRPAAEAGTAEAALRQAFEAAIAQARGVLTNDFYEKNLARKLYGRNAIDMTTLLQVQDLMVPVSVLLDLRAEDTASGMPQDLALYARDLAAWLRNCAIWVHSGIGAADMAATLPAPPALDLEMTQGEPAGNLVAHAAWLVMLHRDIRRILDRLGLQPQPAPVMTNQDLGFAAA